MYTPQQIFTEIELLKSQFKTVDRELAETQAEVAILSEAFEASLKSQEIKPL